MIVNLSWGPARHCDAILWILSWLFWEIKVNKTNHVWNWSMLLCEWEQFLAILLYLHVTFSVFNSCDLFNAVSCYKILGHWFIALSTCGETCLVEESIDSLPIFNLGFCSVTLEWRHSKKKKIFWKCFLLFNKL